MADPTAHVTFHISERTRDLIVEAAAETCMTPQEWVRESLEAAAVRPPEIVEADLRSGDEKRTRCGKGLVAPEVKAALAAEARARRVPLGRIARTAIEQDLAIFAAAQKEWTEEWRG